MAQSWFKSLPNPFKKKAVALSPESYLESSRRCLREVRTMTSPRDSKASEIVNYNQCIYLVNSLEMAVQKANLFILERNRHHGGDSVSTENVRESTLEHLKILCMLAKKVKCFVQGCCNGHWLQAAVMLTNLSDCTASLGFDLKLFTVLFPLFSALPSTLSLDEVSTLRHGEGELVKKMASNDEDRLVTKLSALIQNDRASKDDLELAAFLLERLDRFKQSFPSITPGPPQPILHERDLTNLKHMVQIGRGGSGTVHKASWLGIDVAVKSFHGTDNLEFKKEVQILAGLSHPNIVSFLCHGKDMGECFIVVELMDRDLFSLLKERLRSDRTRSSPFSVFEEFDIILQIAEAMDYLHDRRVLHRDLKSHNILVRCMKSPNAEGYEYVQVKVSDFGLSRTKEYSMTQSHMTPNMGTARWMAPELMKSHWNTHDNGDIETAKNEELLQNFPFKCDVYSFGMVCLEILTGDVPFPNMTANDVKGAVCAGERPQLPDRCHRTLKALIEKCWNPEASSRPSFGDICTELRILKSLDMTREPEWRWTRMAITIADLRSVMGKFAESNLLGRGDCSVVHQGILADGRKVAVKRVMGAVTRLGFEFIELQMGGWRSARHPQLVDMLGYGIDDNDLLLVNEYMSGGTLAQLLLKYQGMDLPHPFTWMRRLKIAVDIARALKFMRRIDSIFYHFHLKSSNVLLDDDFNAKVSGFGQTRRSAESWLPQGAAPSGNMAPELARGGVRNEGDHVYSFGVVLVELITGCPSVNKETDHVTWFRERVLTQASYRDFHASIGFRQVSRLGSYLDEFPATESMPELAELAMDCTATDPRVRPDLDQVLNVLRGLL